MKTTFNKAFLVPLGLMLASSQKASASIGEKFHEFIGKEFSNFEGLYIMAGVIISSLVVYILFNHFGNSASEKKPARHGMSPIRERQRYHHHNRVIRKTS